MNRRARKRVREAKKKARPELKTKEMWHEKRYFENFDLGWEQVNDTVDRIDEAVVGCEEFIDKYERPKRPVVISGVVEQWQAPQKWNLEVGTWTRTSLSESINICFSAAHVKEVPQPEVQMWRRQRGLQREAQDEVLHVLHDHYHRRQSALHL